MIARLKIWAAAIGAALLAIGLAVLEGMRRGRRAQRDADKTEQAAVDRQAAEQSIHAREARDHVDAEVSRLPDALPQRVGDADPDSSSGHLRDDGWMR